MLIRVHVAGGLICVAIAQCWIGSTVANAADPAKAPDGWGDLKFGMTPSEVLEKLGPAAEASRPEPARQLMLADGETPDVQAAVEMANRIAAAAEPNEQTPKAVAAKKIRDLIRHRTWKGRLYASPTEEHPLRSISGELETLSGRSHQMVHEYVVVRTRNKRAAQVALLRSSLDQKSRDYLKEVERAVYDLTELLMDEERKALAATPLDPRLIRIKPVVIRIKQPLFCKCRYELAGHLAFMFR